MSPRFVALFAPLAALAALTCKDATGVDTRVAATVRVSPDSVSIRVGHTLQMRAVAIDSAGDTLTLRTPTWESSDTTIVVVSATGLATARSYGPVTITATVDSVAGSATVRVLVPVATIRVAPLSATLVPGGTLKLTATLIGQDGSQLSDRDITWIVNGTSIAVTPIGMVRGLTVGQGAVKVSSEGETSFDSVRVAVTQPVFTLLASGESSSHTCALTAAGEAFCWGWNVEGTLGNGTVGDSVGFLGGLTRPTGVISLSKATSITTGSGFSCAVDGTLPQGGPVFCWGYAGSNSLGNGSFVNRSAPYPVLTTLSAVTVVSGAYRSCLLAVDSLAYCWGETQPTPRPMLTPRKFRALFAGNSQVCGIAIDSLAYCGSTLDPVLVDSALEFTTISIGDQHTCGIAADSVAYCWGQNSDGQLGDGTTTTRFTLAPVAGGYRFLEIAAGRNFTCGIVTIGSFVYCWGDNTYGQLGRSGVPRGTTPVAISGNRSMRQLAAGELHACAIDFNEGAFCWGWNYDGQLGDGTQTDRFAPVRVAGQP